MGQAPGNLTCRVITDPAGIDTERERWRALLGRSASNEPTLSPLWLSAWWRVFGPQQGRRLRLALFEAEGRLVGLAPLVRRDVWHRRCVPLRRLEFLASGERPADAICSDYLNVVAERGAEAAVAGRFAAALAGGEFGAWDELVLPLMDGSGPMPGLLAEACKGAGLAAETAVNTHAPHIPLPARWDDYLQALPRKRRQMLRYSLRDFEAWAPDQRVERVTAPDDLERGADILIALHKLRWRDAPQGGGVFRSPHFNAFHAAVMPQLLEAGALELLWLHAQGRPVAAMYNLIWGGKTYFYQSGRDPGLPANLRPGVVIIAHAIRSAIEAGRREFDFLGGVTTYKTQLALASRPLVELRVARPGARNFARHLVESGVEQARKARHHWRSTRGQAVAVEAPEPEAAEAGAGPAPS